MAVNELHVIRSNLSARLQYIKNPEKTNEGLLVAGFNCTADTAYVDMMETKKHYAKTGGRLGYHLMQSFRPGEITPERALEFGQEFIRRYLHHRYEALVSVHTDKSHVHCHVIWNSVSFMDGKKYHAPAGQYLDKIRYMSDDLCREWGLSVIEQTQNQNMKSGQHYAAWQAEQTGKESWRSIIRRDIDNAIQVSFTPRQIWDTLQNQGYRLKAGKYLALKAPGQERFIRLRSLGEKYQEEAIKQRVLENWSYTSSLKFQWKQTPKKLTGFRALYWRYMYMMGMARKGRYPRYPSKALRPEILKLERYIADFKLLNREKIETMEQLVKFRASTNEKISSLTQERTALHKQKKTAKEGYETLNPRITEINKKIANYRKELRMTNRIEKRSIEISKHLTEMEKAESLAKAKARNSMTR